MKNQKALNSFVGSIGEIAALLDEIKDTVADNHMGITPEDVNWGHAGNAKRILSLLNEVAVAAGIHSEN